MMLSFEVDNSKFNYRVAGILLYNNKVLFQRSKEEDYWFMPGGRVEFHEAAEESLKREMLEEFNTEVTVSRLVWVIENFFELDHKKFHEIGLFYLINLSDDHLLTYHDDEFVGTEDEFVNKWINLNEIDNYNIVPEFIKSSLKTIEEQDRIEHIINRDR